MPKMLSRWTKYSVSQILTQEPQPMKTYHCQRCNRHFDSGIDLRTAFPDSITCQRCLKHEHLDYMTVLHSRVGITCPCDDCTPYQWYKPAENHTKEPAR